MFDSREDYQRLQREAKEKPRIRLLYDGSCAHFSCGSTRFFLSQEGFLSEFFNVHFLRPGEEPDVIWVASDKYRPELDEWGVPIILEDVFQGPDIFESVRVQLQRPSISIFAKAMVATDYEVHNSVLYNYSIHQNVIANNGTPELFDEIVHGVRYPAIRAEDHAKTRHTWNYIAWPQFTHGFNHDSHILRDYYNHGTSNKREYDISFVGNVHNWPKDQVLLKYHRELMWKKLQECGGNNHLNDQNNIGWHNYWDILRSSKVVVSPWGWEPYTIRDIEAVLAGAILIKPDTGFATTHPYIPHFRCKPDFSDLKTVAELAVTKWESSEDYRSQAYAQLQTAAKFLTERIYSIITDAISQNRSSTPSLQKSD